MTTMGTGWSRYSKRYVMVTCPDCGEFTPAVYEQEYGQGDISPAECGACGEEFPSTLDMEDYDPREEW